MALFCATLPLFAQSAPPEAIRLVNAVSAKSAMLRQYQFQGDLTIMGQKGTAPAVTLSKVKIRFASAPHGKSLTQISAEDKDEYLILSNGEKRWAYVPKLKKYTEEEGAAVGDDDDEEANDQERDRSESFARMIVPSLADMAKNAQAVNLGEPQEVKYEKKKQRWPVLKVMSQPDSSGGQTYIELVMDPETLRIGKMVLANISQSDGKRTLIRMDASFESFQLGAPVPDSIFEFDPPKNAKLAETLPIPGQTGSALLNQTAPDFELKTLTGEKVKLSDLRGKPVVLDFWASWCGPCRRELPELAKVYEAYKDKGLLVFGVNDEGRGKARDFAEKAGIPFPTLDDSGLKAHRLYRVRAIPAVFVISPEGKIVRFLSGSKDQATLRTALKGAGL